jgi:hypothetical protein
VLRSPEKEVEDHETGARGKLDNTVYRSTVKPAIETFLKDLEETPALVKELRLDAQIDPGLEIKSVNQFQYQEMAQSGQVLQSYYDQVQTYLAYTNIPFFILLIKNRNSMGAERGQMPFLEFIVLPDKERQTELKTGLSITKKILDEKVLPPRPFLRESTQCQFCRFKHICWPKEKEPLLQKIEEKVGVAPEKEILESAVRLYNKANRQIGELKKEQDQAKEVLLAFFKATGQPEVLVDNIKATYLPRNVKLWDKQYLKDHLTKEQLAAISNPDEESLKELIAAREIDAIILEASVTEVPGGKSLNVREFKIKESQRQEVPKEGIKDDKGTKPSKKMPKVRPHKARNKGGGAGERKRHPAKGSRIFSPRPGNGKFPKK